MSQQNVDHDHELHLAERRYVRVKNQRNALAARLKEAEGLLRKLKALADGHPDSEMCDGYDEVRRFLGDEING